MTIPDNLKISEAELSKLMDKFGPEGTAERLEELSDGIAMHGYKYKSHYRAILVWDKRKYVKLRPGTGGPITAPITSAGNLTVTNRTAPDFIEWRTGLIYNMFERDFQNGLRANIPTKDEIRAKLQEDLF